MKRLSIDIETHSDIDLSKCGVYKYVESPQFEILLFGYSVDGGPVKVVDLACGEKIPDEILDALTDESVTKWAFNSQFERICLSEYLRRFYPEKFVSYSIKEDSVSNYLSPVSWKCTMTWSAYLGLPLSLEGAGKVLGLSEQKLKEGKALIRYFCVPCKPTKVNGGRCRNLPMHDKEKWDAFVKYNARDVEVELSIQERLKNYPVPDFVWEEFWLDQEINDRGIALDMEMAEHAISFDKNAKEQLVKKIQKLTGVENPNSVMQMKAWLLENGIETESLDKKAVKELITSSPSNIREVLEIRQKLAKSSVKKYQAMEFLYDDIPDTLSQLIRTAFVPRKGMKFVVADFSAIEARVLSYLAKEEWRSEVFKNNGDIYCASASAMFGVPVEKHGVNAELRQKGKIAELALGYGGSVGALTAMGALDMGLKEDELKPLVDSWRSANPNIVQFWWSVDRCVKKTVTEHIDTETHGISFSYKSGMLFIKLPSGRRLSYVKPKMGVNAFGSDSVLYEGIGTAKKWEQIESYGPKFVENIVQAISRDILAYAMRTLSHCFICGHVHDELIIECSKDVSLDVICEQMGRTPPWIPGLILRADGYECDFYQKD